MIKTKLKQKEQRREHRIEFAEEQSARVLMLLQEEGGFLEGDKEQEFNGKDQEGCGQQGVCLKVLRPQPCPACSFLNLLHK